MGGVGLYGRPPGGYVARIACVSGGDSRWNTNVYDTPRAGGHKGPYTTPAPTDGDGLFLRLMRIGRPQGSPLLGTTPQGGAW